MSMSDEMDATKIQWDTKSLAQFHGECNAMYRYTDMRGVQNKNFHGCLSAWFEWGNYVSGRMDGYWNIKWGMA